MRQSSIRVSILVPFLVLALGLAAVPARSQSAAEILSAMDTAMNFPEGTMVLSIEDRKANGTGRRLEARVLYALDAGTLMEFSAPEREKGKRVLMIGDSMWIGSPAVSRPLRLSGKDAFMGTSFTNDDVMNLTKADDYEARIQSSSAEGWTLELAARKKTLPYPRLVVEVTREYLPLRMWMYALSGKEAKTIQFSDVRDFEGKPRPATMTVTDAMTAGNRTIVSFLSITAGAVHRGRLSSAGFMK